MMMSRQLRCAGALCLNFHSS